MIIVLVVIFVFVGLVYYHYEVESSSEKVWDDIFDSTDESEQEYQELYKNYNTF